MTKHLNIEQNEAVKIIIDFDLNKFYAYLEIDTGSKIVFLAAHTISEIYNSDEMQKYMIDWKLPIDVSNSAERQIAKK